MPKRQEKKKTLGQGGYVICEQDSIMKENSTYRATLAGLENEMILKCNADWAPRVWDPNQPFGGDGRWGRTTIIPALFSGSFNGGTTGARLTTWRSDYTTAGHQLIYTGATAGNTIAEDWKVAWAGLAFPNKQQHISEIRMQIGDRKFMRFDLSEMALYNKPALIFTEGWIIDEETAFDMYGFFRSLQPGSLQGIVADAFYSDMSAYATVNQRIVMLGFAAYRTIDKALGNAGSSTGV